MKKYICYSKQKKVYVCYFKWDVLFEKRLFK